MQTTVIETATLSDAASMVEVARAELNRGGFAEQAAVVRSLEVFTLEDAQYAAVTLSSMKKTGNDMLDAQVRHTVAMLTSVIEAAVPVANAG